MAADRLDFVVMGATGFTGSHVVGKLMDLAKERGGFTWGVAGRNLEKLRHLLHNLTLETGQDATKVPVIIADINDERSLIGMTKRARVVLNCCGPYRFYGEKIVKACIQTKTHQVDVSGEPQFMEEMQLYYNEAAADAGVYIISACGMSGLPADFGIMHFTKLFEGVVNQVELIISFDINGPIGYPVHYATWESAIHGLKHLHEVKDLRKKLFSVNFPRLLPTLKGRGMLHKSPEINSWCIRFSGADRSVVRRGQHYLYTHEGQRPIQCEAYLSIGSLFYTMFVMFVLTVVGLMATFGNNLIRKLLLKYPEFFSLGTVSHQGPNEEQMNNIVFHMTFNGKGWKEKAVDKDHFAPENKEMAMRISARNPGYGLTCTSLILAAMTILTESDNMPGKGGVLTPGVAFRRTTLAEQLQAHNVNIEVISKQEIW